MMKIFQRGFFCDDESLGYPYYSSTVTAEMLFMEVFLIPIIIIVAVECWGIWSKDKPGNKRLRICGRNIHPIVEAIGVTYMLYLLGFACSFLINQLIKRSVGRLRPHFIDVCKPDWSHIECYTSDGRANYVDPIPCTAEENFRMLNSRMSFTSGHASLSTFAMVYMTIYLQARLHMRNSNLNRILLQILLLTIALYTGLSRIHDYKHHWSDVLMGIMEGFLVAYLWTHYVTHLTTATKRRHVPIAKDNEAATVADINEKGLVAHKEALLSEADINKKGLVAHKEALLSKKGLVI